MGQFPQPHEQEDLPFFLPLNIYIMINATIIANIAQMIIVAAFSQIQESILIPPFICLLTVNVKSNYFEVFTVLVSLPDSL